MFENEMNHAWYIGTRHLLIKNLKKYLTPNSLILDAGCGTGGTFSYLKKAGFRNITSVDNSEIALKFCKKRGVPNLRLASVNKLPFKNNTFDAVICMDVLYHQGVYPQKAVGEFYRVLKKGGLLYIQEPAFNWLISVHDKIIQTNQRFTKSKLSELLELVKFKIIKSGYFNTTFFTPIVLKRLLGKFLFSKKIVSDVQPLPAFLNSIYMKTLLMETRLTDFVIFPFGLSVICLANK